MESSTIDGRPAGSVINLNVKPVMPLAIRVDFVVIIVDRDKVKMTLTIEHINAQSLQSNLDEIKILLAERNIDILCVSEAWLLAETIDSHVNIPNFKLFRCDQGRGGGVCIYVSNQLKTNVINLSIPKQPCTEDIWFSVQSHMLPAIIVGCINRHLESHVASLEYIQDVFRELCVSKIFMF